ncbi:MOSC domain-containing protein [Actinomadura spongiicola]|uniref:MOSC domain-containing protein n=1 Tax=Actinomadura spongiicola TaxID=2303421 RepID=A0A372G9T1_9ACTN|nr:MOSC N-terminal beta barrel domain-containing protein [Actinomadura spongiicola]RFS82097.1 MOSC domain-containing protein [Actinomadura spongiicola]
MAVVTELYSYPVKGCAGVLSTEAALTEAGLAHDRTFMVVDEHGVARTQRRDPRLAVVRPEIDTGGARLTLRAPGAGALRVDVELSADRRAVEMFGAPYPGIDQGDVAARWLTEWLGKPSRLVRVPPEHDRVTDGWTPGTSGYADSSAVLLISRASLQGLNARLEGPALPMNRFRPNIVVDGWDRPHREDEARRVIIGNGELGYAKLAIRCVVTTVDQHTGVKSGPEPLRTLAAYRRASSGGVAFGAKFAVVRPGKLAVGDEVVVTSWEESEL